MKKTDLRNGMVVEYRDGGKRIVNDESLLDCFFNQTNKLSKFNDDLLHPNRFQENLDIIRVYPSLSIFKDDTIEPIWERKEEVDWEKVPFGTRVRCWDIEGLKYEGKFVRYDKNETRYPFDVLIDENDDGEDDMAWQYCELVGEDAEVTLDGLVKDFNEECKNNGCSSCKFRNENGTTACELGWILENYTLIRK